MFDSQPATLSSAVDHKIMCQMVCSQNKNIVFIFGFSVKFSIFSPTEIALLATEIAPKSVKSQNCSHNA